MHCTNHEFIQLQAKHIVRTDSSNSASQGLKLMRHGSHSTDCLKIAPHTSKQMGRGSHSMDIMDSLDSIRVTHDMSLQEPCLASKEDHLTKHHQWVWRYGCHQKCRPKCLGSELRKLSLRKNAFATEYDGSDHALLTCSRAACLSVSHPPCFTHCELPYSCCLVASPTTMRNMLWAHVSLTMTRFPCNHVVMHEKGGCNSEWLAKANAALAGRQDVKAEATAACSIACQAHSQHEESIRASQLRRSVPWSENLAVTSLCSFQLCRRYILAIECALRPLHVATPLVRGEDEIWRPGQVYASSSMLHSLTTSAYFQHEICLYTCPSRLVALEYRPCIAWMMDAPLTDFVVSEIVSGGHSYPFTLREQQTSILSCL